MTMMTLLAFLLPKAKVRCLRDRRVRLEINFAHVAGAAFGFRRTVLQERKAEVPQLARDAGVYV
jgi:hypothetical protein